MTTSPGRQPRNDRRLNHLHYRVMLARTDVQLGRTMSPGSHLAGEQLRRSHRLMDALQEYSDAASSAGVPVPYQFRDELRLYRSLYAGRATS